MPLLFQPYKSTVNFLDSLNSVLDNKCYSTKISYELHLLMILAALHSVAQCNVQPECLSVRVYVCLCVCDVLLPDSLKPINKVNTVLCSPLWAIILRTNMHPRTFLLSSKHNTTKQLQPALHYCFSFPISLSLSASLHHTRSLFPLCPALSFSSSEYLPFTLSVAFSFFSWLNIHWSLIQTQILNW